ncbi:unnamed protein product [Sphenostylis stenocarpa]|uniref:Replication factor C subunit 3 n=1 Tax=Sphenostylis stenocarpa TaxID=92480 RepID=A0AA86SUD8_9FABA|nr:unnamed protein product [Sphenostylis stenocarpa]
MQMPSPTMKQTNVSDQNMSKNHISPTRHKFRSRRRKTISARPLVAYDINDTNSPYYKGLTDQSLAIVDAIPSCAQPHHPHTPPTDLLSSPYYKGLTDYSLALGPWNPHNHPIPFPNSSLSYPSSPYYRGLLTDYSLVLHAPSLQPPFNNFQPSIRTREGLTPKLSLPNIKPDSTLKDLMVDADQVDFLLTQESNEVGNCALLEELGEKTTPEEIEKGVDEEKPLRENGSETIMVESVLEDKAEKMMLEKIEELMTDGVNEDVNMVIEEKPLRESVLEQASDKVEGVLEETILDTKMMTSYDVIEEKPLRERVSETREDVVMDVRKEEEGKGLSVVSKQAVVVASESQLKEGRDVYDYIWAAKYQPMTLEEFICNKDKAHYLKTMVKNGCGCSHFIFEGPPSVGKRSMIRAMLREVFGDDRVQVTEEYKNFNLKGEMVDNVQVRVKKSLHHVEVNLSETNGYEKHVIVDLFKETYGEVVDNSQPCCPENCKAIVLYEAERLSIESLLYIKWLLEKYKGCNKVFFCCSDESKLQPVKPLCITLRLSSPSTQELFTRQLVQILENIAKEEGIEISRHLVENIIWRSKNNLCQAIRSLEATCRNKDALKDDDVILTGWEEDILDIAKKITQEQSPRQLYAIRRKLRSLMSHDVPADFVYKCLVPELTNLIHHSLRPGVVRLDRDFMRPCETKFETMKQQFCHAQSKQAESDEKSTDSTKKNTLTYLKVEEFIAKFMSWYKNWCEKDNKR